MIPDSIKTGFSATPDDEIPREIEELQQRITTIMMVLMKRALMTAATFVAHSGGTMVGPVDIANGIKFEATTFFDSEGLEEETEQMSEYIFGDHGEEEDSMEESEDDEDVEDDEDDMDPEKKRMIDTFLDVVGDEFEQAGGEVMTHRTSGQECECRICHGMSHIEDVWNSWDVSEDPIKHFLKNHVEATEQMVLDQLV